MNEEQIFQAVDDRVPPWAKKDNWLMMGLRGSHAHGTYIPPEDPAGVDDTDVFVVAAHPQDFYLSLRHNTEQHFETAGEDLDIVVYDIRKFVALLKKGNPNVHQWLWTPLIASSSAYTVLRKHRRDFLSRDFAAALVGYAYAQIKKMTHTKQGYMGAKRAALVDRYGYDIKNAAHCIRLLHTGIELAKTGVLPVRLPDSLRKEVMVIKRGEKDLHDVQFRAQHLFNVFDLHRARSPYLKKKVQSELFDTVLLEALREFWGRGRTEPPWVTSP